MTIYVVVGVDPIDGVTLYKAFKEENDALQYSARTVGKVRSVELAEAR